MIRKRHPIKSSSQRRAARRWRTLVAEVLESRYVLASAVLVVNSTADPGDGIANAAELTLREAIEAASATPSTGSPTRIDFNIPASDPGHVYYRDDGLPGRVSVAKVTPTTAASDSELSNPDPDWPHSWFSIKPQDNLPAIASGVIIDGYTQPGARANSLAVGSDAVLRVELDGTNAEIPAAGLRVGGQGNTIRGLVINRFKGDDYEGGGYGIEISAADNNVIEGNYLGTDIAGLMDLGNAAGMYVWHSTNNRIGGTTPAERNVISGNDQHGIRFALEGNHLVQGNYIGTTAVGTAALGNGGSGVELINASSIVIGGVLPGEGNVIANNGLAGVTVRAANLVATGNAIVGNRVFANAGLGIDLGPDVGVTPNDIGDADTGANNRQNFPVLMSVQATLAATTVAGTLNSTPSTMFRIELFSSAAADPTGFGEGQTLLGSLEVTTDAAGVANFSALLPVAVTAGQVITATATVQRSGSSGPSFGDTSEFSQAVLVDAATSGEIRGTVWHDADTSGRRESDEPGVADWTVFLDDDHDGELDSNERFKATDVSGNYSFQDLAPGDYIVAQLPFESWELTNPLALREWIYVVDTNIEFLDELHRLPGNPRAPIAFTSRIEIYEDRGVLHPVDSFTHHDFDDDDESSVYDRVVFDVESGPGGDVYVGVENVTEGQHRILQFTYEGEFVRSIELPDEEVTFPDETPLPYPLGFDVLPDGSLLVARPNSHEIVKLNPDGSVQMTIDEDDVMIPWYVPRDNPRYQPPFRPIDVGINSRGDVVYTNYDADPDFETGQDQLLNIRDDDLVWVGAPFAAELRNPFAFDPPLQFINTVGNSRVMDALETADGDLFATLIEDGELVKFDSDENVVDSVETYGIPRGLAIALNEVPYGDGPVRGDVAAVEGDRAIFAAQLLPSEIPAPAAPRAMPTGRGTWSVHIEAGQVANGVDFGVVELSTFRGAVFNDLNGDGARSAVEPGLEGWVVYADLDDDGVHDGREPSAISAADGSYTIEGIRPGTHKIREVLQPAWKQTGPSLGYHEVYVQPGAAIVGLEFGNQPCPANWLVRSGEVLRILGDSQDNQVFVSVDRTGRLTVSAASDCFYEFTGIRRIVAEMGTGADQLSFAGSNVGPSDPIALDLRLGQDDDQLSIGNWPGSLNIDLGAGDDELDLTRIAAAVGLDSLDLNVVAGKGNDVVNVSAPGFVDIAFKIDLGDGNDRANVDIPPDPQTVAGKVRELRATIVGGPGNDVTHSCIPMSTSDVLLDIDLGGGDDTALLELEGRFPAVPPTESHSLHGTIATAAGNDDVQVLIGLLPPIPTPAVVPFDVVLDVDLGRGNDHFMFDVLPDSTNARGKVRELHLTVDAGVGDDEVQDCEPMTIATDAFVEIDLGAGNDRFMLEQPAFFTGPVGSDSGRLSVDVDAGMGNDAVEILFQPAAGFPGDVSLTELSLFDLFIDLNLGAGNDQAMIEYPTDPNEIVGKVRELHISIDAGAGDDVVQDCEPGTLASEWFVNIDLGAGNDKLLIEQHGALSGLTAGENGSLTANVVAGAGDDLVQILIGLLRPQISYLMFHLDLGAGNDRADLRYGGGGPPDPAGKVRELHLNVLGGSGNDTINAVASAFFEVDVQANLGAGNDRFALSLNPQPLPVEDLTSIVNVIIDAGSGLDGIVIDVERTTLTEILVSFLIVSVGAVSVDALFPLGLLSVRQAARNNRAAGQSLVATTWDGSQLAVDIRTGTTDDLIKLELDPAADGSVRFLSSTGDGNDNVQLLARSSLDVFAELNLGAGDDTADLRYSGGQTADPTGKVRELRANLRGGVGNDNLQADVSARLADLVFMEFDGGAGNDEIGVSLRDSAPSSLPEQPLHLHVLGGDGNDELRLSAITSRIPALLDLLLDGGQGRDRGAATPNVKVKNCETVVPDTASLSGPSTRLTRQSWAASVFREK